jgi:hypothetical protein
MHCESNERRTNQKLQDLPNGRLWMNTLGGTLQIRDLYSPRVGPYNQETYTALRGTLQIRALYSLAGNLKQNITCPH